MEVRAREAVSEGGRKSVIERRSSGGRRWKVGIGGSGKSLKNGVEALSWARLNRRDIKLYR